MARLWEADPTAEIKRRLGKSAAELGDSEDEEDCPDILELENGDFAIIGRNLTAAYSSRLPIGIRIGSDECLAVIPRNMMLAAKADIPDA
jgi:hypothetical protein